MKFFRYCFESLGCLGFFDVLCSSINSKPALICILKIRIWLQNFCSLDERPVVLAGVRQIAVIE